MKTHLGRNGFTLVEMLTVVVIIGILAGILFKIGALVSNRTSRSLTANRLEHLKLCIESYYKVYGEYPRATGVTWEEPGGSAGRPEDWDVVLSTAREADPSWENPEKQYWTKLYPYIYRDPSAVDWSEFSAQAGGGGAGAVVHTNTPPGKEQYPTVWTNAVHSIYDGMGNAFHYSSVEPYQSYTLTGSDHIGERWTE